MFFLRKSLKAFAITAQETAAQDMATFSTVFNQEVCALTAELLPLQQGLQNSSYAISDKLSVAILKVTQNESSINIKAGLLYNGIIAGCSCADDPTPLDETNEYCDVIFCINKKTAETSVKLV